MEDVVVVGMGIRFPGRADSEEGLWSVLSTAESQWSEFPGDRLNIDGFFHPSRNRQGSIPFRGAHLLRHDVTHFDAAFFAITADEANAVDPQQRMLLEVSYEALENAGLRKEDLDGSSAGVFVGSFVKDYEQICLRDPDDSPQYAATGNGIALMSNRVSYFFNFTGPSETVDTGCSGSLVSVHNAMRSLQLGESSLAIAGGAGLILTPATMMPMTALNFLSPDGKCFTFDARANGYGRGEGIGVVVLKRLSDALRDNDTIRAVIRGSSKNQDGRTIGITLPSSEAQAENIRLAYASARVGYEQTAFVECHGTGTQAGDWRELKAISQTISEGRPSTSPLIAGSLKPNVGHLEGAAGVAGMIKAILVLERGQIPPQANYETPNANIDFSSWNIKIPTFLQAWPLSGVRRVSVNCFGFGGSNVHMIMDDAANYMHSRCLKGKHNTFGSFDTPDGSPNSQPRLQTLLCFSGQDKAALGRVITSHRHYLETNRELLQDPNVWRDYAYTLACRRTGMPWRTHFVCKTANGLASMLEKADGSALERAGKPGARMCFIFGGQGSQWAGMGRDLCNYDVFVRSLESASNFLKNHLHSPYTLLDELFRDDASSRISRPEIAQPATTALQIALVDLLHSLSIKPTYVIGHSSGEIAAAYACGSILREEAWTIAHWRGFYAAVISFLLPEVHGGMMAVGMAEQEARDLVSRRRSTVQIVCVNSPSSVTLSGRRAELHDLAIHLKHNGVFYRILPVEVAYHSSTMRLVSSHYAHALQNIGPRATTSGIRMFSTVTGLEIQGTVLQGDYWATNMVSQVRYSAAVQGMMGLPAEQTPDAIIELSPKSQLQSPTTDIIKTLGLPVPPRYYSVSSNRLLGQESVLELVGQLWDTGVPIDMLGIMKRNETETMPKCLVGLPSYPWNHTKSYWHESHLSSSIRFRPHGREDLIGVLTPDSTPFEPKWRGFLRVFENPWLQDHKIQKTIIYPAAGIVTMILEAAKQLSEECPWTSGFEIRDLQIERAIIVPETKHGVELSLNLRRISLQLENHGSSDSSFALYGKQLDASWQRHATGFLRIFAGHSVWDVSCRVEEEQFAVAKSGCKDQVAPRQLYEVLDNIGMNYGPTFRNIRELHTGDGQCVSRISIPDTRSKMPEKFEFPHLIHPATLDSMFHTLFAIEVRPMVPVAIQSIYVSANIGKCSSNDFHGVASCSRQGLTRASADVSMFRETTEKATVIVKGLELATIPAGGATGSFVSNNSHLATEIIWKEDITFANPVSLREVLGLLSHRTPGLSVLQLTDDEQTMSAVLDAIAPRQQGTPRLLRYTLATTKALEAMDRSFELTKGSWAEPFVQAVDFSAIEPDCNFDLIIAPRCNAEAVAQLHGYMNLCGLLVAPKGHYFNFDNDAISRPVNVNRHPNAYEIAEPQNVAVILPEHQSAASAELLDNLKQTVVNLMPDLRLSLITLREYANGQNPDLPRLVIILPGSDNDYLSAIHDWDVDTWHSFHKLQSITKRLLWVTHGCHRKPTKPGGASVMGLIRTLISEDPLKRYATLDLGHRTRLIDAQAAEAIFAVMQTVFLSRLSADLLDAEYAEEDGRIYIPRLVPIHRLNQMIHTDNERRELTKEAFEAQRCTLSRVAGLRHCLMASRDFRAPHFEKFEIPNLGDDQIEIELTSTELTIMDMETLSGLGSRHAIGMDVTGCVRSVGRDVPHELKVGDEVAGLTFDGSLQSVLHLSHRLVRRVPTNFVPSLYVSAYYALVHVGRARKGTTVLIHGAASAFGLAAVIVAQALGLNLFTAVSGAEAEKQRTILCQYGIPRERVMDGDAMDLGIFLPQLSRGKGVDIAYNVVPDKVDECAKCVRNNGCFVQLDMNGRMPSQRRGGIVYGIFDPFTLLQTDQELAAELLDQVLCLLYGYGVYEGLPSLHTTCWDIRDLDQAMDDMARVPHLGCAMIRIGDGAARYVNVLQEVATKPLSSVIDCQGTYLVVGGFLGLGRSIAELLITHGARHFAFLSRSGVSTEDAQSVKSRLETEGVQIRAFAVDICDAHALQAVVDSIGHDMPPIRGVFQCAAVIRDAIFDNMTFADWQAAVRPKTVGTKNLVEIISATGTDPFFIFLASSAGVIGNRGQANYAAGNSFEDAMARALSLQGKHAVSIDLGPVLGAGMLADDDEMLDMLRASGFHCISHDDFLKVVSHAITGEIATGQEMPPQVTLGVGTGAIIRQDQPADPYWTRTALYSYLNLIGMPPPDPSGRDNGVKMGVRAMLDRAPNSTAAGEIVATGIQEMLAKAMTMLPEEIDMNKPPSAYGMDSLVAIGLRSWIQENCGVEVSLFEVLSDQTVADMGSMIAKRGGFGGTSDAGEA